MGVGSLRFDQLGPLPPDARLPAPYLRAWRLQRGYPSVALASAAGVAFATVSRIENGHRGRVQTLIALARALDVTVEALLHQPPPAAPRSDAFLLRTRSRRRSADDAAHVCVNNSG